MSKGQEKFDKVMHEWGQNKLRSSSGHKVKYPSEKTQALAIAFSEARSVEPSFGNGGKVKTEKLETGGRVLAQTGNPLHKDNSFEHFEAEEIWDDVQQKYKDATIEEIIEVSKSMKTDDNHRLNMESILPYLYNQEDLDKYAKEVGFVHGAMARGGFFDFGRPNSAIARDKKYLSQEPHEQAYAPHRKTIPSFYKTKEEGGSMASGGGVEEWDMMSIDEKGKFLYEGFSKGKGKTGEDYFNFPHSLIYYQQSDFSKLEPEMKSALEKSSGGSTMAKGGKTQYYDNGGMTDEKKKIEDKIKIIKASLLNAATPELVKEQYRTKLAQLEKQLSDMGRPAPVKEEVSVVAEEPIVEEKPVEEAKPIAEVIAEAVVEEVQKQEAEDVALPEEKAEEGTKKLVKAHIEGTFEGTIEVGDGKSARNFTVPGNKTYYINIEPGYRNLIRNTLDYNDLDYTSRTMDDKTYQVFVSNPELLERVFKIYNMKRAHKKDAVIEDITTITGKFKKGGKVWVGKADKKEKTLRNKAIRMGLIKGQDEKLTEKDLNKIAKQSKGWKKRVEIIRAVNQVKNKK